MKIRFNNSSIKAIFSTIPEKIINLESQVDMIYNGDYKRYERIKKSIGLDKRHITDCNTTTLDLCIHSAKAMLKSNIITTDKIEAIIFVTQTPDYMQPGNAHILHGNLDLKTNCVCFDINCGCSGYIYGLYLAYMLISSGIKNVLLCAGDTISKIINPLDSNLAPIFGDAGSVTLISYDKNSKSYFNINTDGKGFKHLIYPNSAFRLSNEEKFLYMNGAEIFNFSIDKEPKSINEILEFAKQNIENIDYIFFHQANAYIIKNIAHRLNIPLYKTPNESISKYGNTSSASIPLAMCDKLSDRLDSDLKVILSGFGVGLSWGNALITLNKNTIIFEPLIYKENI